MVGGLTCWKMTMSRIYLFYKRVVKYAGSCVVSRFLHGMVDNSLFDAAAGQTNPRASLVCHRHLHSGPCFLPREHHVRPCLVAGPLGHGEWVYPKPAKLSFVDKVVSYSNHEIEEGRIDLSVA